MGKIDEFLVHKLLYPDPVPILNSNCSVWFRPWCQGFDSLASFCLYFILLSSNVSLKLSGDTHSSLCSDTWCSDVQCSSFLLFWVSVGLLVMWWVHSDVLLDMCRYSLLLSINSPFSSVVSAPLLVPPSLPGVLLPSCHMHFILNLFLSVCPFSTGFHCCRIPLVLGL